MKILELFNKVWAHKNQKDNMDMLKELEDMMCRRKDTEKTKKENKKSL